MDFNYIFEYVWISHEGEELVEYATRIEIENGIPSWWINYFYEIRCPQLKLGINGRQKGILVDFEFKSFLTLKITCFSI